MSGPTHLAATPTVYEPCEECGAALDPQQRYCVNCAARRGNGANPSSRYFASMSKRARRPIPQAAKKPPSSSRAAAVGFFALLPIAVAIGVVVGRGDSGSGDESALLQALREQNRASVASTTAGAGAAGAPTKLRRCPRGRANEPHGGDNRTPAEARPAPRPAAASGRACEPDPGPA